MFSAQSGSAAIDCIDLMDQSDVERRRRAQLMELRALLSSLLHCYDGHDIAAEMQCLHNAQPVEARGGYRMEVVMLSAAYQSGGYDDGF